MQTINTTSALLATLLSINAGTFVRLTSKTEPKLRKTGNPLSGCKVEKLTVQTLQWGYSYQNAVNNRIGEKDAFTAEPLKWGEWIIPNKVIAHKGNLYARFYKVDNNDKPVTTYLVNGVIATEEQVAIIQQFLVDSSYSTRQAEVGLTERQVKPRDFAFKSILAISANGEQYQVVAEQKAEVTA